LLLIGGLLIAWASPARRVNVRGVAMEQPTVREGLRDQFFQTMLEATFPLQGSPDPEVTLEALIEAAQMLREHLERELAELRQEQAD
jgi:hypothetical protein